MRIFIFRMIAALVCWSITAYVAWDMSLLAEQQELWGWRALFLEVSFWSGLLLLVGPAITRLPQRHALLLASCATGVLLSIGFMPMPFVPALFIGFVPLLWAEDQVSKARPKTSKWTIFKLSFNAFFIWNVFCTFWLCNASLVAGLIANVLNGLFMSTAFTFYHVFKKYHDRKLAAMLFVSTWLAFEWGHLRWAISWAWLNLGNGLGHAPWMIQWYEATGALGGSLWILTINALVFNAWTVLYEQLQAENRRPTAGEILRLFDLRTLVIWIAPLIASLVIYWSYSEDKSYPVEVVSVQPNFEPHYEKFDLKNKTQMDHFLALSAGQVTANTDYLLFPETSFGTYRINEPQHERSFLFPLQAFVAQYPKLKLITGVTSGQNYPEQSAPPTAYRVDCVKLPTGEITGCQYREYHNAAIQISNETDSIPLYKKSKLVIGAETLPFVGDIEWLRGWVMTLGGVQGTGLGTQPYRTAFASNSGKVGPIICYESSFGEFVSEYVKWGAQALFVLTNDGWWDNTPGHIQHMHFSSIRAIETRRPVVRSANTGISAFVNSRGDILRRTQYDEAIAIRDTIYLQNDITFYVRYGDLIARIAAFLFCWWWVSSIAKWLQGSIQAKNKPA